MCYWLSVDDQSVGPYSLDEVKAMLEQGQVHPETMAAADGSEDWVPLSSIIQIQPSRPTLVTGGRMPAIDSARYQRPPVTVSQPRTVSVGAIIAVVIIALVVVGGGLFVKNGVDKAAREKARAAKTRVVISQFRSLNIGLKAYLQGEGKYPSKEQGLAVVMRDSQVPIDPWGNPYQYEIDAGGTQPVIISCGPDGKLDTQDDLRSDSM